jgi:hypothetical protein
MFIGDIYRFTQYIIGEPGQRVQRPGIGNAGAKVYLTQVLDDPLSIDTHIAKAGGIGYLALDLEGEINRLPPSRVIQAKNLLKTWERDFVKYYERITAASLDEQVDLIADFLCLPLSGADKNKFDTERWNNWATKKFSNMSLKIDTATRADLKRYLENNTNFKNELLKASALGHFIFRQKNIGYKEGNLFIDMLDPKVRRSDCGNYSLLFIHLANKINVPLRYADLLKHATVFYPLPLDPNKGFIIESTSGRIAFASAYSDVGLTPKLYYSGEFALSAAAAIANIFIRKTETMLEQPLDQEKVNEMEKYNKVVQTLCPRSDNPIHVRMALAINYYKDFAAARAQLNELKRLYPEYDWSSTAKYIDMQQSMQSIDHKNPRRFERDVPRD